MDKKLSLLLVFTLILTACQSTTPPNTTGGTGGQSTAQRGGRVVAGVGEPLVALSPILGFEFVSASIWSKMYLPLLRENPDTGELEGLLAQSFTLSPDRLTVTFKLRDGLVWSDGVAFTGEDYKYTAEAVTRSKKTRYQQLFKDVVGHKDYQDGKADNITGITLTDSGKTITVKRTVASCVGLGELGESLAIVPKHHFSKDWDSKTLDATKNIDASAMHNQPPASMGPFVLKEHRSGVEVSMTRNDKFFRGAPNIDEFIVKMYAGPAALKTAILTGELTYATFVPANDVPELQAAGTLNFHRAPNPTDNQFVGWNQKSPTAPWLANKDVRQALWYGYDVKGALQTVMGGYATQTFTHTAPQFWSYPESGINKYDYSVDKAKQLLEKAGAKMGANGVYNWSDGKPMVLKVDGVGGGAPPGLVIEVMQEQYKKIGIQVQPNLLAFPAFVERTVTKAVDRDGGFFGTQPGGSEGEPAYGAMHSLGANNFFNYSNPAADAAIVAGRDGPDCSQAARKQAYATFNRTVNEDAPNLYLWMRDFLAFSSKKLTGFQPKPFDSYSDWNIEKWTMAK